MNPNRVEPVIVALDFPSAAEAQQLVEQLSPSDCRLKVGKELFTRAGPALVCSLVERGFEIFLDLKFHDIPNTVAGAVVAAADMGVWMVNVHASGGRRMMEAAVDALATCQNRPLLTGVTLLTSMSAEELPELGIDENPESYVLRLAALAAESGLDGVVCSAREAAMLRRKLGPQPQLVTPGIRPSGSAVDDQRRAVTPKEAIAAGANHLVIGRPITAAPDPLAALSAIRSEIALCRT